MKCVIDRFEGKYAVVEYQGNMLNLPRAFLPEDIREGEVLDIVITVDREKTEERKESAEKLMNTVWQD